MVFTDFSERATQSHLQGTACFTLEFGVPIDCPETSVTDHQSTPCNIPEEQIPHTFNHLRFLSSEVKEISLISEAGAAEGKVADIYTTSKSSEDNTAGVLRKIYSRLIHTAKRQKG